MTSRRFVVFVLILCIIGLWLVSRPSAVPISAIKRGPNQTAAREPATSYTRESAQSENESNKIAAASTMVVSRGPAFAGSSEDLRQVIKAARKKSFVTGRSGRYRDYRERNDLKATPKRMYEASLGNKIREIGGYAVYGVGRSASTLENFDTTRLPVVTDRRARTGVVNGDIRVVFREYPERMDDFAHAHNMRLIRELPAAKLAFFMPKHLPTNLISRIETLNADPQVKDAELDIIFRAPVPK